MPSDYTQIPKDQAKSSIKSLSRELGNLDPSTLLSFFEIDLSSVVGSISSSLIKDYEEVNPSLPNFEDSKDNILRFHNNIRVFNSYVFWQGKTFFPAPIQAEGYEISSRGILPTPRLSMSSQSDQETEILSLIRRAIRKYGDIVGAKVTRIRTYAKFLDKNNFADIAKYDGTDGSYLSSFPEGYEPDPYAELPRDIFFIERKASESKTAIVYELSSSLDVEGIKLPRRTVQSKKCGFAYRGCGCFYESAKPKDLRFNKSTPNIMPKTDPDEPDQPLPGPGTTSELLAKCQIRDSELTLPEDAPPVATIKNDSIAKLLLTQGAILINQGEWRRDKNYEIGDYVFKIKDNIKYYFVCKKFVPSDSMETKYNPPNPDYWISDMCSKTLEGCRKRWGLQGGVVIGETKDFVKGQLQFGGFPNATKLEQSAR